jgi:hypothetical protein
VALDWHEPEGTNTGARSASAITTSSDQHRWVCPASTSVRVSPEGHPVQSCRRSVPETSESAGWLAGAEISGARGADDAGGAQPQSMGQDHDPRSIISLSRRKIGCSFASPVADVYRVVRAERQAKSGYATAAADGSVESEKPRIRAECPHRRSR